MEQGGQRHWDTLIGGPFSLIQNTEEREARTIHTLGQNYRWAGQPHTEYRIRSKGDVDIGTDLLHTEHRRARWVLPSQARFKIFDSLISNSSKD